MEQAKVVPESVLKKRKRDDAWAGTRASGVAQAKKDAKRTRVTIFSRAEQFVKEYNDQQQDMLRLKRSAKSEDGFYVNPQAKLMFVMRLRGLNDMHPKTKKILQLMRLLQINNGVFMKVQKTATNALTKVEPYVMYGFPSLKTVRELIYKRGHGKVGKQRLPLTDNSVVEAALGKYGIICIEDLIHEIFTVGPHFKEANNFLWPFKLSNPKGGLPVKRIHYIEGGQAGNREAKINDLVAKMI